MSNLICPHCRTQVPRGATVCTGCQAEVKYGPANGLFGAAFLAACQPLFRNSTGTVWYSIAYTVHDSNERHFKGTLSVALLKVALPGKSAVCAKEYPEPREFPLPA